MVESDVQSFEAVVLKHGLLPSGQTVLAAVSGGADSLVMLDLLARLSPKYGWKTIVIHFNHQLRGEESDRDQTYVQEMAHRLGFPCVVGRGNVLEYKAGAKWSLEQAARQLRHRFFAECALRVWNANAAENPNVMPCIALAHHADDQVELFMIRLLRGAGPSGLAGMNWKSPSPVDPRFNLVRPLLGFNKGWILNYAQSRGIEYRSDSSNRLTDILRNRIRHELLPNLLSQYQPSLSETILRTMEILREESDFVIKSAKEWLENQAGKREEESSAGFETNKRDSFGFLHPAVQRRVIQSQLIQFGLQPDYDLIEKLRTRPGQPFMATPGKTILRDDQGLIREIGALAAVVLTPPLELDLGWASGETSFGSLKICWEIMPCKKWPISCFNKKSSLEYFDFEKIGRKVTLRNWVPGDRFQPIGMMAPVKLQDLFVNLKVPVADKHNRTIGEAENGALFWVEGLRIAEFGKVTPQTKVLLKWRWERIQ